MSKKKTKVYIEWQDFEENYSIEKESQLIKYIKDNYGCEMVTVDFKSIFKDSKINDSDSSADEILEKNINVVIAPVKVGRMAVVIGSQSIIISSINSMSR